MTLPVSADLPPASPIDAVEPVGTRDRVRLADLTGERSLLHVQGPTGNWLARSFGDDPVAPGGVVGQGADIAACLRPDLFLVLVAPDRAAELFENVPAGLTVTDITHGRGMLRLTGPLAATVLPKLCGLNFHESAFPDRHAAPTSFAAVESVIVRHDKEADGALAYYLIVDRSHSAYVWDVTVDAMQEYLEV